LREITRPLADFVSSFVVAEVTPGGSATGLIVIVDVLVAVLNAVVPPLVVVSAVLPAVPLDWSHARKVIVAVPW